MKTALLIVDMQNNLLDPLRRERLDIGGCCEYINHVAGLLRQSGQVVVHIKDVEGASNADLPELNIIDEIVQEDGDLELTKEASNAFWETNLEQMLRDLEVGLVIVAGFAAEHCVTFTYNGAAERGFKSVILQNGILSKNPQNIEELYRNRDIISYPVVEHMCRG